MRSRGDIWLAAFALVLTAATVGYFLGRWSATPSDARLASERTEASTAEVMNAVADLRRSLEEGLRALQRESPAQPLGERSREPAMVQSPESDDLRKAVEKLTVLLQDESIRARSDASSTRRAIPTSTTPGYASLEAMRERYESLRRGGDESGWSEKVAEEFKQGHLLWTTAEVVARYGVPTSAYTIGGGPSQSARTLYLSYEGLRSSTESCAVKFRVREGVVLDVDFDCEELH